MVTAKKPILSVVLAARIPKMSELTLPDLTKMTPSSKIEIRVQQNGILGVVCKKYPKRIPKIRNRESFTEFYLKNTGGFYKSTVPIAFS